MAKSVSLFSMIGRLPAIRIGADLDSADFSDVVNDPAFQVMWSQQKPNIIDFVIRNFDDVIAHAFRMHDPYMRTVTIQCTRIMVTDRPNVRRRIWRETKLGEFLLQFVNNLDTASHESIEAYFRLLPALVVDQQETLCPAVDNDQYFITLCKRVDLFPIYHFLYNALTFSPKGILRVLERIKFCAILVENLFQSPVFRLRSQKLVCLALSKDCAFGIPAVFVTGSKLDDLLDLAFHENDVEILTLVSRIEEFLRWHLFSQGWRTVQSKLVARSDDFCDVILRNSGFSKTSESCTRIVCSMILTKRQATPKLLRVVVHLSKLFFELSHNSFLHNCFVNLITLLAKEKCLTPELVREMGICERIVEEYKNRDVIVTNSNWGHMRILSRILDSYAREEVDVGAWQTVVCDENKRREGIISRPYGNSRCDCMGRKHWIIFYASLIFLMTYVVSILLQQRMT